LEKNEITNTKTYIAAVADSEEDEEKIDEIVDEEDAE